MGHWLRVVLQTCDLTFVPGWQGGEEWGCRRKLLAGQGGTLLQQPSTSHPALGKACRGVTCWAGDRGAGVGAEVGAVNSLGDYTCMSLWEGEGWREEGLSAMSHILGSVPW